MLKASDITIDYQSPDQLKQVVQELAPKLQFSFGLDKFCILMALAGVESTFGKYTRPKHEDGYAPGGDYFKNVQIQGLYKQVGALASCSWGPWQLMAIKAIELGYEGHPAELHDANVSGPFVVKLLNKIVQDGATAIDQVLDAYNTGSFRMGQPPKDYIARFWNFYGQLIEEKLSKQEGNA